MKRWMTLALLLVAARGWAWTFVQGSSSSVTGGGCSATTNSITVSTGNFLTMGCYMPGTSGFNVTDTAGNSWLLAKSTSTASGGDAFFVYYVKNPFGGATSIVATETSCVGSAYCVALEYSGINNSSPYDVASGSAPVATGLQPTSLSTTTTAANELMVGFLYDHSGTAPNAQNGTARTKTQDPGGTPTVYTQDALLAAPGAYTSTWTEVTPFRWVTLQVAFFPSVPSVPFTGQLELGLLPRRYRNP